MRCQSSLCKINGCMFPQACPNDSPMTAPEPLPSVPPTEPRKCPACGTKLIPASQAFSEIRERITAEEPPQKSIACPNCGFPSTVPTTVIRGAMDCPNCHYRFHPRPFTPDEPQDLKETLAEFEGALLHETVAVEDIDVARVRVLDARAALVALFDRQREEIKERDEAFGTLDDAYNELIDQVASLSSQLELARDSAAEYEAERNEAGARARAAESSLERLKADQLTAEEAIWLTTEFPKHAARVWPTNWASWCACVKCENIALKLRRLSQSEEVKE